MDHGGPTDWSKDRASSFKTRVGIWMFLLYAILYAGFVLINSFRPQIMADEIGSVNLAVVYGFGLILFALMLAAVYNAICSAAEEELNEPESTWGVGTMADGPAEAGESHTDTDGKEGE